MRLLACAFWAISLASAQAQVPTRLRVEGACPSEGEVRESFRGLLAEPSAEAWELHVQGPALDAPTRDPELRADATMELHNPAGELALRRTLTSALCGDLAEAFAVIVHAHFLDLRLVSEDAREHEVIEPVAAAEPEPAVEVEVEVEPEVESVAESEPAAEPSFLSLGVAGGIGTGVDPVALLLRAGAELEWQPTRRGLLLRLELEALFPASQADPVVGDIRFVGGGGRAVVGGRFPLAGDRWSWGIGGSLGLGVLEVTAADLPSKPSVLRVTSAVGLLLEMSVFTAGPFFARAALHADLVPFGHRYRVEPIGQVARSSLLQLYAILSLGVSIGV